MGIQHSKDLFEDGCGAALAHYGVSADHVLPAECFRWFRKPRALSESTTTTTPAKACSSCSQLVEHFVQGTRGELLCRSCFRREDEALLQPISREEQQGLDWMASILDELAWDFWKPGPQPAEILPWLFLGDLEEAMDFNLLHAKKIDSVVNLINWWELAGRLPEVTALSSLYAEHHIDFHEIDSEDRLFFDLVGKSWPEVEPMLKECQDSGKRVLVNCKAGHNRSAVICLCWLMEYEGYSLLRALEKVLDRRGNILSNHGFRLQLVRFALARGKLGSPDELDFRPPRQNSGSMEDSPTQDRQLKHIINKKRLSTKYDHNSKDFSENSKARSVALHRQKSSRITNLLTKEVTEHLTQRTLKMELLACLYHKNRTFLQDYEYTTNPATIIGSGFSGDVTLCKTRQRTAVMQNKETAVRCVKRFDLTAMNPDRLEKLKNEALIYLSLEHPHIARLFDVYENDKEVALVMQYCSGGTIESSVKAHGAYSEKDFQRVAVEMLVAVSYIHKMGIVHRDIKPRNWVYEADGRTVKLIDFGFSAKAYLSEWEEEHGDNPRSTGKLFGCMGTLGYLAPEVVKSSLGEDAEYNEKCDLWSLGAVFYELLTGEAAFHREGGQCEGYTEEVILREIEGVTEEFVDELIAKVPQGARAFLKRLLTPDPALRPSAREVLDDPYLATARAEQSCPADALSMSVVLERFRSHGRSSKTSRAWLLAVARSPTYLPWREFLTIRNTFKIFDAHRLCGTVNLQTFLTVIIQGLNLGKAPAQEIAALEEEISSYWKNVCGAQESLSYCEFMATLLPPIEDVFEDVDMSVAPRNVGMISDKLHKTPSFEGWESDNTPKALARTTNIVANLLHAPMPLVGFRKVDSWKPSESVACYLPLLRTHNPHKNLLIFSSFIAVQEVVEEMNRHRLRYGVVSYPDGKRCFIDYIDINSRLVHLMRRGESASKALQSVAAMPVGQVANCSGHTAYVPVLADTPLKDVLKLVSTIDETGFAVRRAPILSADGQVLHVFSAVDFLDLALRFPEPSAVLKSRSLRVFDRRSTILETSVGTLDTMASALETMDTQRLTVCPATLRELSGDLGGVVANNVISASDLKLILVEKRFDVLDMLVDDFLTWRQGVLSTVDGILRKERLRRFNVVSVDENASLHTLAHRLLASKLQRIFLSCNEIARIVGIVSARDILMEVLELVA